MNTADDEPWNMKQSEELEQSGPAVLSENSPIRLGLILGLFSVCVATIGAAWYLASALTKIETKLDAIGSQVALAASNASAVDRRQSEHEREDANMWRTLDTRVSIIEKIGSPKIPEIERKVADLEYEVRVLTSNARNGTKP